MSNQITKILSKDCWKNILINENDESLIEVKETNRLRLGLDKSKSNRYYFVREKIAEKLLQACRLLPKNIILVLIEGYRTLGAQQELWDVKFQKLKEENPTWTEGQIDQKVRLVVAKPSPLANHYCGGAVDVTLAYSDGTLLDMGTPYPSEAMSVDWHKKFQMLSSEITDEQKTNRKILRDVMRTQDFVWYPGEWWHYCYGDRMWAVYTNRKECFYGSVELDIHK